MTITDSRPVSSYREDHYKTADGPRIYYRDYAFGGNATPMICMHGLSRNSADFEDIAPILAEKRRVIVPDMRGRGRSDPDPQWQRYTPVTYASDMIALLASLGIERPVAIGTSMGGLMAMIMAAQKPGLWSAVVLNDIGPEVGADGLERLKGYVGKEFSANSWEEAAERVATLNRAQFPGLTADDWLRLARRMFRESDDGTIVFAYDPAIAKNLNQPDGGAAPDLWPLFDALGTTPTLVLRGELSDILSDALVSRMKKRLPGLRSQLVSGRGHAPLLDEPESLAAITALLAQADATTGRR